jgi:hypothetical protein
MLFQLFAATSQYVALWTMTATLLAEGAICRRESPKALKRQCGDGCKWGAGATLPSSKHSKMITEQSYFNTDNDNTNISPIITIISGVKQRRVWSILGWVTTRKSHSLSLFFHYSNKKNKNIRYAVLDTPAC